MKNKILFLFFITLNFFGAAYSQENFTFNVTEIEILNKRIAMLEKKIEQTKKVKKSRSSKKAKK